MVSAIYLFYAVSTTACLRTHLLYYLPYTTTTLRLQRIPILFAPSTTCSPICYAPRAPHLYTLRTAPFHTTTAPATRTTRPTYLATRAQHTRWVWLWFLVCWTILLRLPVVGWTTLLPPVDVAISPPVPTPPHTGWRFVQVAVAPTLPWLIARLPFCSPCTVVATLFRLLPAHTLHAARFPLWITILGDTATLRTPATPRAHATAPPRPTHSPVYTRCRIAYRTTSTPTPLPRCCTAVTALVYHTGPLREPATLQLPSVCLSMPFHTPFHYPTYPTPPPGLTPHCDTCCVALLCCYRIARLFLRFCLYLLVLILLNLLPLCWTFFPLRPFTCCRL